MTIDWTLPVETMEDPPRPVRVLATDHPCPGRPVVVSVDNAMDGYELWFVRKDGSVNDSITLRNVAPPKPEPVLREAWVVWDADGYETVWCEEKDAADRARHFRGVYARAAVMSDGSQVPSEASGEDAPDGYISRKAAERRELDALRDRDHWKSKAEALQAEVERLQEVERAWSRVHHCEIKVAQDLLDEARQQRDEYKAEVDRQKPVVDAAVKLVSTPKIVRGVTYEQILEEIVRAYQSKQAPTEPVKNCTTCRFSHVYHADEPCNVCADNSRRKPFKSYWEPRHD